MGSIRVRSRPKNSPNFGIYNLHSVADPGIQDFPKVGADVPVDPLRSATDIGVYLGFLQLIDRVSFLIGD